MLEPTFKVFPLGAASGAPAMAQPFTAAPTAAPHTCSLTRCQVSPSAPSAELAAALI